MSTVSHSAAVEDTTPEDVLSQCRCHRRIEQSRSSQGYKAWCGCHEILIPLAQLIKVFLQDENNPNSTEVFYLDAKRIAHRSQWNTNERHKKIERDEWKNVMLWNGWSFVVQLSCFIIEFIWVVINCIWNRSISLLLGAKVDFGCS